MRFLDKLKKKIGAPHADHSHDGHDHAGHLHANHEHAEKPAKKEKAAFGYSVLVKPVISEKSSVLASTNVYAFFVSKDANKRTVARAIKQVYGVEPETVRILRSKGKQVRSRIGRGFRSDTKKAYVQLPKGKSIVIHENV